MPPVTCHILDTARGEPAAGVVVAIYKVAELPSSTADNELLVIDEKAEPFGLGKTNTDGRVPQWTFPPGRDLSELGVQGQDWQKVVPGVYRIRFQTGKYFKQQGSKTFFPFCDVLFTVEKVPEEHYHIPLLLSGHSYTTYRGS